MGGSHTNGDNIISGREITIRPGAGTLVGAFVAPGVWWKEKKY